MWFDGFLVDLDLNNQVIAWRTHPPHTHPALPVVNLGTQQNILEPPSTGLCVDLGLGRTALLEWTLATVSILSP